jgi:O-antigen/teichoic acid export membrane protein
MFKLIKTIFFKEQFQKLSIYGFGQLFNLVTPLLVAPYIIAVCGEENYGKIAVGMAIAFFLIVFVDFGSELSGVKEVAVNRENNSFLNSIFVTTYAVKFLILLLVLFISALLFTGISYFHSNYNLFILSLTIIIGQFLNPTWFLQGMENVTYITYLNIFSKIIYVIAVFLGIKVKADFIWVNFYWGLGMIIANSTFLILILKKYHFKWLWVDFSLIKSHLKRDFSLFSSQIFVSLQMYAPVVLVSFFGNDFIAGQYRIIEQIIVILRTYILLFFNYTYPRVCYLLSIDFKRGLKAWIQFHGFNIVFILLIAAMLYSFPEKVVAYFSKNDTKVLSELFKIGVFIPVLLAITVPLKQLILAFNHSKYYVYSTYFLVLFGLVFLIFMQSYFGLKGVFYSMVLSELIGIIVYIYKLKNDLRNDSFSSTKATS